MVCAGAMKLGTVWGGHAMDRAQSFVLFATLKRGSTSKSNMTVKDIVRRQLLSVPFDNRNVTSVEVREIDFEPGQETGRHLHPCPVLGYVVEGSAVIQIEGQPERRLDAGEAFYEPAGTVMRFDNASSNSPLKFVAYYLLVGKQDLIQMLPPAG